MEKVLNVPVQMISCTSTVGNLTPIRFRFENEEHEVITVKVDKTLSENTTSFNGIKEIHYICEAYFEEEKVLFILKYAIESHKWIMFKRLN